MGTNVYDPDSELWSIDLQDDTEDIQIEEYDLTATPNDFNVLTIHQFIESGAVVIPGFQRNYVWDIRRASKLIESLLLGLPVPQLFLYEEARNRFLVIDGQQRLMSLYYFVKMRFPRKEKRSELRRIFEQHGRVPDDVLHDDRYFLPFNLNLPEKLPEKSNRFAGLNYATLGDYRTAFDLRPIRNVIVKQNSPKDDDSSVYEIFNRLNSGGINLTPQEIRASLYHCKFFDVLHRLNALPAWRRLIGLREPDLHLKDLEVLLRSFAMLINGGEYTPSMTRFLNRFSKQSKKNSDETNAYLEQLFVSFLTSCSSLGSRAFQRRGRFNLALFEAVFAAVAGKVYNSRALIVGHLSEDSIRSLEADEGFMAASREGTTKTANVAERLQRATALVQAK